MMIGVKTWFASPGMSHYREKVLEHVFISEILQECAFKRRMKVEVLRPEVDEGGYDLVLKGPDVPMRHVQLKSTVRGASKKKVKVNPALAGHPGWCVIWFDFQLVDVGRVELLYRWLDAKSVGWLPSKFDGLPEWRLIPTDFDSGEEGVGLTIEMIADRLFESSPSSLLSGRGADGADMA